MMSSWNVGTVYCMKYINQAVRDSLLVSVIHCCECLHVQKSLFI